MIHCPRCGAPVEDWTPYKAYGQPMTVNIACRCKCGHRWQVNGVGLVLYPFCPYLSGMDLDEFYRSRPMVVGHDVDIAAGKVAHAAFLEKQKRDHLEFLARRRAAKKMHGPAWIDLIGPVDPRPRGGR